MPRAMCIKRAEPAASSDETTLRLPVSVDVYEKKEAGTDSTPSTCKNANLVASQQPAEAIHKHLGLLVLKLREAPSAACLNAIKCYLELDRGDVYWHFVESDGFGAMGGSFGKMGPGERQIVCSIAAMALSKYDAGPVDVLAKSICRVPTPETLEILGFCTQKLALSFVFEDGYLEWLLQEAPKRDFGRQAATFLTALHARSTTDQKMVIRYLLVKTDFFKHVSCTEDLRTEIRRTTHCRPVLSSVALDERLKGVLEIVDSLGLCNFIMFIMESLLFEPERFLQDTEEKFMKPMASGAQGEAGCQAHTGTGRDAGSAFEPPRRAPEAPCLAADAEHAPGEIMRSEQRNAPPTAGKARAAVHAVARGPPKRRSAKKDVCKEMPDLSKFQRSYMPLRWVKIAAGRTVWRAISAAGVESLFSREDLLPFEKSRPNAREEQASAVLIQPVIDAKKNNAMNIALSRVKHTDAELKRMILGLELRDENLARQLLHNFPTEEELEALEKREKGFGRAEEFFKECQGATAQLRDALCALHFLSVLGSQSVSDAISVLERFYKSVMTSKAFVELLRILLFLGNVLNANTVLGNADGFSLGDIGVFARVRGKSRESVLDVALRRFSMRAELRRDLGLLSAASQVGLDGVDQDMREIRSCYTRVHCADDARVAAAVDEYTRLAESYEGFKRLHSEFEAFLGTKADSEFYSSLGAVYREL